MHVLLFLPIFLPIFVFLISGSLWSFCCSNYCCSSCCSCCLCSTFGAILVASTVGTIIALVEQIHAIVLATVWDAAIIVAAVVVIRSTKYLWSCLTPVKLFYTKLSCSRRTFCVFCVSFFSTCFCLSQSFKFIILFFRCLFMSQGLFFAFLSTIFLF